MNLFIGENYIDTIGNKINVLQLIRQVADDDEIIQSEVLAELSDILDYSGVEALQDAINNGEEEELAMHDDILYVGGGALKEVFEELFPGDYTSLLDAFVNSIENATAPTLKLNHNLVPVVDPVEQEPDFQSLATRTPQAKAYLVEAPVAPFPGDSPAEEVLQSELATLNLDTVKGDLRFNNSIIRTFLRVGSNGVLFNVEDLYHSIYGLHTNPDYLQQLVRQNAPSITANDIEVRGSDIYLSTKSLAVIHPQIAPCVEWFPTIMKVTNWFNHNPHVDASFDLLGDLVV